MLCWKRFCLFRCWINRQGKYVGCETHLSRSLGAGQRLEAVSRGQADSLATWAEGTRMGMARTGECFVNKAQMMPSEAKECQCDVQSLVQSVNLCLLMSHCLTEATICWHWIVITEIAITDSQKSLAITLIKWPVTALSPDTDYRYPDHDTPDWRGCSVQAWAQTVPAPVPARLDFVLEIRLLFDLWL